jgi:hypothetical protein
LLIPILILLPSVREVYMILDVNKEKIDYPSGNMVLLAHNMGIGKQPLHNTLKLVEHIHHNELNVYPDAAFKT